MDQILSMLSKEIKDTIVIQPEHNKTGIFELSAYSDKTSEYYFFYQSKSKEYFFVTYSLLSQSLKSKIKVKIEILNQEISQIVIHPINNDHLSILGLNSVHIIKSLSEFTKDNLPPQSIKDDGIYSLTFGKLKILQFNFSNYDNYFGILLSNNTFIFDSITQHSNSNVNHLPLSESSIVSFNFIPIQPCGWCNFMIIFMNNNGTFFLCGPLFPDQFTLDKEYILAMKENIAKKKHESPSKITDDDLLNDFLFQNIQEGIKNSFKSSVLIKSSDLMKKFNSNLNLTELQLNNISLSDADTEKLKYKQFFILEGLPTAIIRISMNNTIDVMIIAKEDNPVRKGSNKGINALYHIENIELFEQAPLSSKFKFIQMNNANSNDRVIILVSSMSNVYEIRIPYINQLKDLLDGNTHNDNMIYQFESKVIQLISNSVKKNKGYPINYYFIAKIFSELVVIAYVNSQFVYESIDLTNSPLEDIREKNKESIMKENDSKANEDQLKGKVNKTQETNSCLITAKRFLDTNKSDAFKKEFEEYSNDYKDIVPKMNDVFSNQMNHLLSMLNKSKDLLNILQLKYNNYLNSIENINELTKDISSKRRKINNQISKIGPLINTIAKVKGKANNAIIKDRMNIIRDQADELSQSIESLKGNYSKKEINNISTTATTTSIQLSFNFRINGVSSDNIYNKDRFLKEIFCLKDKIQKIERDMLCFNK